MNDGIIAIGLSGGVDSSAAAYLLSRQWKRVVGVSHYIWEGSSCCNTATLQRARDICRQLDIPFFILNLVEEFKSAVVDDFVESYRKGQTPNPCVRCNEFIRFGLFPEKIKELLIEKDLMTAEETLHLATGHYVRSLEREGRTLLAKGKDPEKEQSYMLYHINPDILPRLHFPLGEMSKPEVVELAAEHGFPTNSVKESQDVCFVEGKYTDFIEEYSEEPGLHSPGPIVDPMGLRLGTHRGYMNYTIGQRQGLGLSDGPWYVSALKPESNTVVVARRDDLGRSSFRIHRNNWFLDTADSFEASVRIRYNAREIPCVVEKSSDDAYITLQEPHVITPGQSAVLYDGEIIIGGGIIVA